MYEILRNLVNSHRYLKEIKLFIMYIFCCKLVCLSRPVKVTVEKTLTYHEICPFSINYESVMFYSTGLRANFTGKKVLQQV